MDTRTTERPKISDLTARVDAADRKQNESYIRAAAAMSVILLSMRQAGRLVPTNRDMRTFDILRKAADGLVDDQKGAEAAPGFTGAEGEYESIDDPKIAAVHKALFPTPESLNDQ